MKYERDVLCPSCGAVIDHWSGNTEEPEGMVGAMLFQGSRDKHGQSNEICRDRPQWINGWDYGPLQEI